jgi:hypothetical protein
MSEDKKTASKKRNLECVEAVGAHTIQRELKKHASNRDIIGEMKTVYKELDAPELERVKNNIHLRLVVLHLVHLSNSLIFI